MVDGDDAERALRRLPECVAHALDLGLIDRSRLVPVWAHRVEPDDDQAVTAIARLALRPLAIDLPPRLRESADAPARDVVIPRDDDERPLEAPQQRRPAGELL